MATKYDTMTVAELREAAKQFGLKNTSTMKKQELRELFAGNGMIAYVSKERVDGKLILPDAVQILSITG